MIMEHLPVVIPSFPFALPPAYRWLVERGLVGFAPWSALQPWYFLRAEEAFRLADRWPERPGSDHLFAFARRQDCDDLACFVHGAGALSVAVVHGWTPDGYSVLSQYPSVWGWLRDVVTDIEGWAASEDI